MEDEVAALYQFTYPIKVLNSLTLTFSNPWEIYTFSSEDRFYIGLEFIYFGFDIDDGQKK